MRCSTGIRLSTIITVLSALIVIFCVAIVTIISRFSIQESSDIEKARLNEEQKNAIQDQMLEEISNSCSSQKADGYGRVQPGCCGWRQIARL